ncbi:hypothetical protein, partial [Frankia sp. AgKG'84/4]|uniref:hypothetical protein n=1 Tax=Frankia sp. AgKG'84/4 TaxID=573490 RepID=UPI00202A33CE
MFGTAAVPSSVGEADGLAPTVGLAVGEVFADALAEVPGETVVRAPGRADEPGPGAAVTPVATPGRPR